MFIFLDESGDLGCDPNKNSSRHFTITLLVCEDKQVQDQINKAVHRTLKNKINHKSKKKSIVQEIKGTKTSLQVKKYFCERMPEKGWSIYSITVIKAHVYQRLTTPQGKKELYNYLTKEIVSQLPLNEDILSINLVVDRCKNKSEQVDFDQCVELQLRTQIGEKTMISINHESSKNNKCLQAVDLFCWGMQRKAELQEHEWLDCFQNKVKVDLIYSG